MTPRDPVGTVQVALRRVWELLGPIEPNRVHATYLADELLSLGCEIARVRRLPPEKGAA